ncbi:MAG: beta-lactamase family protein [Actinobacteria bacterium]|nr:beta-lactamase family protein [Actinomycetota bacterium]
MRDIEGALGLIGGWPVPAAAAAVVGAGGVLGRYGPTDRPFRLASVTKPLATLAVLVAIEEGAVELTDPAGPPGSTVRHLLAHASGLAMDGAPAAPRVVAGPGTRRIYSNAGFEALGAHLAARTGIPFGEYFAEAVCRPLGLTGTRLDGSPAYGATSTVDDLAAVARELLHPTVIHRDTLAEATAVQFAGLPGVLPGFGRQHPNDWGLGFEVRSGKSPHWTGSRNSPSTFGHFGQSGTFLWVDPVAGVGCVVLTDRDFGGWAAQEWPTLSDAVLGTVGAGHVRSRYGPP